MDARGFGEGGGKRKALKEKGFLVASIWAGQGWSEWCFVGGARGSKRTRGGGATPAIFAHVHVSDQRLAITAALRLAALSESMWAAVASDRILLIFVAVCVAESRVGDEV